MSEAPIVISMETLNKSRLKAVCTSCLHIFRQLAQKILKNNATALLRFVCAT